MTPWELAQPGTEHAHQRAVFAWANCAALYGFAVADSPRGYNVDDRKTFAKLNNIFFEAVPALSRLFAIHNQGHGDAIRGARAKAEGVKAGVPDMMLPVALHGQAHAYPSIICCGLFIELKKPDVGRRSAKQSDWIEYLNLAEYRAVTCYGWLAAVDEIKAYMRMV